jgi:dihydrofolate reductase
MSKLIFDLSISLDGYVAGTDPTLDEPLGRGGEQLHEWALAQQAWRAEHGREGGEEGQDSEVIREHVGRVGAEIMGRGKFGGPAGQPWGDDPWPGWWGEDPPFRMPVFVLTHHAREPLTLSDTTFTFVTDGIESALEQARAAAGDKDVAIGGGGNVAQQYLAAGLVDELQLHVVPILLGDGIKMFGDGGALGSEHIRLEPIRVIDSPTVTHLRYRVVK